MFFQSIYQMMSAGTDLNINIRRTDGKLSVAVMPRRTTLKDETGQAIVPLILTRGTGRTIPAGRHLTPTEGTGSAGQS